MTERRDEKNPTYRFILYGRARSGKTCYLAALAMARKMSLRGYTCDWLNAAAHCPRPAGERANWDWNDPVAGRYLGLEWLTSAIEAIENGATPPGNPNEAAPFRYLFEFRGPVDVPGVQGYRRTYRVEFIDYSGELIDPKVSDMELAVLVRKHMNEADGILVLAEAPRDEKDRATRHSELLKLRRAFDLIQIPKHGLPVALVFNKWDRLGPDFDPLKLVKDDETQNTLDLREQKVIERFLGEEPEPAQRSLRAAVEGKCEPLNFKMFTASALGPCETFVDADGKLGERPKELNPLTSYGLEDPFIWMAHRRDQIRYSEVETASNNMKTWALWQFPTAALVVENRASEAAPYIEKVPSWRQGLEDAKTRGRMTALRQGGILLGIAASTIIASIMLFNTGSDTSHFNEIDLYVRTESNFPRNLDELDPYLAKLREYDSWLAKLSQGSALRSGTMATTVGRDLPRVRQDLSTQLKKGTLLLGYKKTLDNIEKSIAAAVTASDLRDIGDRLVALGKESDFKTYGAQVQDRRTALEQQFTRKEKDLVDRQGVVQLRSAYDGFLVANDLAGAADLLRRSENGDFTRDACKQLREDLKAKAEDLLKSTVLNEVAQKRYAAAATQLTTVLSSSSVENLLGASTIADLRSKENEWIWKPQDRDLYSRVVLDKDEKSCEDYLLNSKLHEMRSSVENYRDFLTRSKKPSSYKLSVPELHFGSKSWWYPSTYSYKPKVNIYVGSTKLISSDYISNSIGANQSVYPGNLAEGTLLNRTREEILTLRAEIKVDSDRNNGGEVGLSESRSFTLSQLAQGVVIPLADTSYEEGHSVKLKLNGWEEAPSLPSYSGR